MESNQGGLWAQAFTAMVMLAGIITAPASPAVTLPEALRLAGENAKELRNYDADAGIAKADAAATDGAYDWEYFLTGTWESDKTESLSTFEGEARLNKGTETGVRKLFGTGTSATLAYTWGQNHTDFPPPPPPIPSPTGEPLNFNDPESSRRYNPAYNQSLKLELAQPLWRGFMAREVKLRRQMAAFPGLVASYQKAAERQLVYGQTEQLFVELLRTEALLNLTRQLVTLSKKFLRLMQNRIRLGRADRVDTAAAEASLISYEGELVRLEVTQTELQARLAWRINPDQPATNLKITGSLAKSPLGKPTMVESEAFGQIHSRYDIRLMSERQKPLVTRAELAKEQSRPQLDLILQGETTGLDDAGDTALEKLQEGKHTRYQVGLRFNWNLENTATSAEQQKLAVERLKLEEIKAQMVRETKRDIRLAILQFRAADRLQRQARRQIASLEKQERAERRKFRQARAEEIGALRYQIEALSAGRAVIDADYSRRMAEASLRLALHRYRVSGS